VSGKKAVLRFDPERRDAQVAYVTERTSLLHETGDQVWVSITDAQAQRFAEQGIWVQFHEEADFIDVPAAYFDPLATESGQGPPEPPADLAATAPSGDETAYYLVQFDAQPDPAWIADVEAAGAVYVQDNPANAVVVRLTTAQATAVQELSEVRWLGLYHPAYACHYDLAGRDMPFTGTELRTLQIDPNRIVATGSGTLEVSFFADLGSEDQRAAVEGAGATLQMDTGHSLIVDIVATQVPALLRVPGVCAVERFLPADTGIQRAGVILGANQVRNFGNISFLVNLDGTGETAGIIDSGFDRGATDPPVPADPPIHPDLAGRIQIRNLNAPGTPANTADNLPHGTHVAGILAGTGLQSVALAGAAPPPPSTVRGLAPAARVILHSGQVAAGGPRNYSGFMAGLIAAHNRGARVHSNSWASPVTGAGGTGNPYTDAVSGMIDRFAYLNPEDLVLFLAHNQERDANGDGIPDMNRLPVQAVAKNILCIGATENVVSIEGIGATYSAAFAGPFSAGPGMAPSPVPGGFPISDNADDVALFSNRGRVATPGLPAAQGRIRPDLVAPGTNILATGAGTVLPFPPGNTSRPNTAPPGFYFIASGTSMATPAAAGASVLVRQYYRQQYGQLRRPVLIEQVPLLVDRPAIAPHTSGSVMAWVRRDTVAGQNSIVGARFDRSMTRVGAVVTLQANVGDHPAPTLVRRGDRTYLLHRGSDNALRLSCYDAVLAPVAAFGTNGVVTIAPGSRPEDDRRPAVCAQGNDIAVVWGQTGNTNLLMQRFAADIGAARAAAPTTLGSMAGTSAQPFVVFTGTRYAAVWTQQSGGNSQVLMRLVEANGTPVGAGPLTLFQQVAAVRSAHLVWDVRYDQYLVTWVDSRTHADGEIYCLRVNADGAAIGAPRQAINLPGASTARGPFVAIHPDAGYVLLWEDDTQPGESDPNPNVQVPRFDVYLALLDSSGQPDARIPGDRLRISDTAKDTAGFGCLVDNQAIRPIWQSNDEINSQLLGVYTLAISREGRFAAEVDPGTPLIVGGNYRPHQLTQHGDLVSTGVALAWCGGDVYLLRTAPDAAVLASQLELIRSNADGLPDAAFGVAGVRRVDSDLGFNRVTLHWADTHLVAAEAFGPEVKVYLLDQRANAAPVANFGVNGIVSILEPAAEPISAQVAHRGTDAGLQFLVAFGRFGDPEHTIRYGVLDLRGAFVVPLRNLTPAAGTAKHGWFHHVISDSPVRSIAAWHRLDAGSLAIFTNRFLLDGTPHNGRTRIKITTLPGDSRNAVIAPRPVAPPAGAGSGPAVLLASRQREYGVAWQYRPAGAPSEIRFTRLTRNGTLGATRDIQVVANAPAAPTPQDALDPQLVWHSDGYGLAWLQQPTGGTEHTLFFTVLDENGNRVDLNFGIGAAARAPDYQVSSTGADVQDFELAWNGRTFRVTWTESYRDQEFVFDGELFRLQPTEPRVRHLQAAIAVPRKPGPPGYGRAYEHPSSALVRATLINGATNLRRTALPNVGNNVNDGYGWGRVNLRQSLAPLPPVTFQARDDASVASGSTVTYHFTLPPDTRLLRITLAWTDPPGVRLVNNLNLRMTAPDGRVYVGNNWAGGGPPASQFSTPVPAVPPPGVLDSINNTEQIVLAGAPSLPAGDYRVEVIGGPFANNVFQQFPGQPFALVFVGSGNEVRFPAGGALGPLPVY
jgi:hypothetical protein